MGIGSLIGSAESEAAALEDPRENILFYFERQAKLVAAASNDTAPALITLEAELSFHGPDGTRELPVDELFQSDGIYNKKVRGEILGQIRLPGTGAGHRGAYGKLRERGWGSWKWRARAGWPVPRRWLARLRIVPGR